MEGLREKSEFSYVILFAVFDREVSRIHPCEHFFLAKDLWVTGYFSRILRGFTANNSTTDLNPCLINVPFSTNSSIRCVPDLSS